jgi:DNA-binding phage protein/TPR repeat protein
MSTGYGDEMDGPGSDPAAALATLRRRLNDACAKRGLDQTRLARAAGGLSRGTVNRALSPNSSPPSKNTVSALARALGLEAQPLLDLLATATGESYRPGGTLGRPIAEWNPLDLEVHPAASVPDSPGGSMLETASALPGYVRRPHDEKLARLVSDAAAGRSGMAVLVGSSSTGKTRACWEVVQPLAVAGWRLWHPFDPARAQAALDDLARVGPRTVVWLNEAQHYLGAGAGLGERLAAGLTTLLADPARGPVLVLGTLWPEYVKTYTNGSDHELVGKLLANRRINVPEAFDADAISAARMLADAGDGQLASALKRAPDGCLAQDLAGGPELLHRYRTASAPARAILQAAMDACRLGTGVHLPRAFLEAAAEDYLTDTELDTLDDNWLEQALAELGRTVHGNLAPLRRIRPRRAHRAPGAPASLPVSQPGQAYRLADYLEQCGRLEREAVCPPASFWHAAHDHLVSGEDLLRLASSASQRLRLQWEHHLTLRAAEHGNTEAMLQIAEQKEKAGDEAAAQQLRERAAEHGSTIAMLQTAEQKEKAGDQESAELLCQQAAAGGHPNAFASLRKLRQRSRDWEAARRLLPLEDRTYGRDAWALERLAVLWERNGDHKKAERLARQAANRGNPGALYELAHERELLMDVEEWDDVSWEERWRGIYDLWQQAADRGDRCAMLRLAQHEQNPEKAERLWKEAVARSPRSGYLVGDLPHRRLHDGDVEGAVRLWQWAAEHGNTEAMLYLARRKEKAGDLEEARQLWQRAAEHGDTEAILHLARQKEKAGCQEEAEQIVLSSDSASTKLVEQRVRAGDREGAERLARQSVERGNTSAVRLLLSLRWKADDREGAHRLWLEAVNRGAGRELQGSLWVKASRWPHGLDVNGTPCEPWSP